MAQILKETQLPNADFPYIVESRREILRISLQNITLVVRFCSKKIHDRKGKMV